MIINNYTGPFFMKNNEIKLSYEFFPPRSERMQHRLWRSVGQLERFHPAFISVTFGALGSDRDASIDTVTSLPQECDLPVAAHLTAAGNDQQALKHIVDGLHEAGVRHIVALRGDLDDTNTGFAFDNTADFVAAITSWGKFEISVGAYPEIHPQATSALQDLQCLKDKLDAGALAVQYAASVPSSAASSVPRTKTVGLKCRPYR